MKMELTLLFMLLKTMNSFKAILHSFSSYHRLIVRRHLIYEHTKIGNGPCFGFVDDINSAQSDFVQYSFSTNEFEILYRVQLAILNKRGLG